MPRLNTVLFDFSCTFAQIQDDLDTQINNNLDASPFLELKDFINEIFCQTHFKTQTSGSTGLPKEIKLSIHNALVSATISNAFFQVKSEDTLLAVLPFRSISTKMTLIRAYQAKAKFLFAPTDLQGHSLLSLPINKYAYVSLTPLQVSRLLQIKFDFSIFRAVLIGGSAISPELRIEINKISSHTKFYETYGMTETYSHIALNEIAHHTQGFRLLDAYQIQTYETYSEIYHPQIFPNGLRVNDILRKIDESHFEYIGRADLVVNSDGIKLHPERLEEEFKLFFDFPIRLGKSSDADFGEILVLFVPQDALENEEIYNILRAKVKNTIQIPKKIYRLSLEEFENPKFRRIL
ncbi:MAG: AMP-binding protein [Chitinophagales bacterium]|jgi:O-succinylbenzoic acid--CoA ligase|nr:AMP-binding protein [Chitinophagales bacterium]